MSLANELRRARVESLNNRLLKLSQQNPSTRVGLILAKPLGKVSRVLRPQGAWPVEADDYNSYLALLNATESVALHVLYDGVDLGDLSGSHLVRFAGQVATATFSHAHKIETFRELAEELVLETKTTLMPTHPDSLLAEYYGAVGRTPLPLSPIEQWLEIVFHTLSSDLVFRPARACEEDCGSAMLPGNFYLTSSRVLEASLVPAASEREMLTDTEQTALDFIRSNPGRTGKEISSATGIPEGTLSRHVFPKLEAHGLRNRRGYGYFIGD